MRLGFVLALLAAAGASGAVPADAHRTGCYLGHTFAVWDVHRVYGTPHGCVWLYRPDGGHHSIGPQFRTRLHGQNDSTALPRDPIGAAAAVCGFSGFLVSWPYFVVTARRVAWGDGQGCHDLGGTAAVTWSGHFVMHPREGRRPARWVPVVDSSSPPLRR
jgi:hypothetical protein